ncbi:inhibitory regulator protein ira1-related [Anaeramoeba ignava]|uniref:Inhibitory regulator protein ira1-related n=1 Tax=Anaeramoeba ignava TaxID=1746090 RepID=A0A9Q0LX79_ANAIG|nr:inhibitory regulator protein ira1-related [Anaeramoeba ignava]
MEEEEEKKTLKILNSKLFSQLPSQKPDPPKEDDFDPQKFLIANCSLEIEIFITLSNTKLEEVLKSLFSLAKNLSENLNTQDNNLFIKQEQSLLIIIESMNMCLQSKFEMSNEEILNLKKKNIQIINDNYCANLLELMNKILFEKNHDKFHSMFEEYIGKLIKRLSHINYDVIFNKVLEFLKLLQLSQTEEIAINEIQLIKYLDYNKTRLGKLLQEISKYLSIFQKQHQKIVADSLRSAIWNWINSCPSEFSHLSTSQEKFDVNIDSLFESFKEWSSSLKKKGYIFWPIQTMLLIISPDILTQILHNESNILNSTKGQFIENLQKSFSSKESSSSVAAQCLLDIYKVATYISKSSKTPLLGLVLKIENILKKQLFTITKNVGNTKILSDTLVSSFRVNPRETLSGIFTFCLQKSTPHLFRLALAKALYTLALEESLPWNTSFIEAYSISPSIKRLFIKYFQELTLLQQKYSWDFTTLNPSNLKKRQRDQFETAEIKFQTLNEIAKIFSIDPQFVFIWEFSDQQQLRKNILQFFISLASCLNPNFSFEFRSNVSSALKKIHEIKYIEQCCYGNQIDAYYLLTSPIIDSITRMAINNKNIEPSQSKLLVSLFKEILEKRNEFLGFYLRQIKTFSSDTIILLNRVSSKLEITLLILSLNSESSVSSQALKCFNYICDEIENVGFINNFSREDDIEKSKNIICNKQIENNTVLVMYPFYRKLAQIPQSATGRLAQQKSIRQLLRKVTTATNSNKDAWINIYERWLLATKFIIEYTISFETNEEMKQILLKKLSKSSITLEDTYQNSDFEFNRCKSEWYNYTGFLCSLSSIYKKKKENANKKNQSLLSENLLIDEFISQLLSLAVCNNIYLRETTVLLLTSLPSLVYSNLFEQIKQIIKKNFKDDGRIETNEESTIFYDQTISIIKNILDQPQIVIDLSIFDFEELIISIIQYLSQLSPEQNTIRMKIKFCHLLTLIIRKREYLLFKDEDNFRNGLLEGIANWISDVQRGFSISSEKMKSKMKANSKEDLDSEKLVKVEFNPGIITNRMWNDHDLAVMMAIDSITNGLIIKKAFNIKTGPILQTEDDLEKRSKLFGSYFKFFTSILQRIQQESDQNKTNKKISQHVINIISNLLNSNVNIGLKHALPLGYFSDTEIRASFLDVFTNILKQGTEFNFVVETNESKYRSLIRMLLDNDLHLLRTIFVAIPSLENNDLFILSILRIIEVNGASIDLLHWIFEKELNILENEKTSFFQTNNFQVNVLKIYSQIIGTEYLQRVMYDSIKNLWQEIIVNQRETEIDVRYVKETKDIDKNLKNLEIFTQEFLDRIIESIYHIPIQFFVMTFLLKKLIKHDSNLKTSECISKIFFNNFICPALISPEKYDIFTFRIPSEVRRGLVLISKTINKLSSNEKFGIEEDYMIPMNKFISQNRKNIEGFLEQLFEIPFIEGDAKSSQEITKKLKEFFEDPKTTIKIKDILQELNLVPEGISPKTINNDFHTIHKELMNNYQILETHFEKNQDQKQLFDFGKFLTLIQNLEESIDILSIEKKSDQKKQSENENENVSISLESWQIQVEEPEIRDQRNHDFMASMSIIGETKEFEPIFYTHEYSKAKEKVFYLIPRRIVQIDISVLIYHILHLVSKHSEEDFIIIIDCTLFSNQNEINRSWINRFTGLVPSYWDNHLKKIIFISPSSDFRKFTMKILPYFRASVLKLIHIVDKPTQIYEYIDEKNHLIPEGTMETEKTIKEKFTDIYQTFRDQRKNVIFEISPRLLHIIYIKESLFDRLENIVDIFHITQVINIEQSQDNEEQFSVKIHTKNSQKLLIFHSPNSKKIVETIKNMKQQYNKFRGIVHDSKSYRDTFTEVYPSDVPGSLLNIALINLGSDSETLRKSAYNLVTALCRSLNFSIKSQLLETEGLCIPKSHTSLVVNLSKQLALTEKHLTLEFLGECLKHFESTTIHGKHLCVEYMAPWLPNLKEYTYHQSPKTIHSTKYLKNQEMEKRNESNLSTLKMGNNYESKILLKKKHEEYKEATRIITELIKMTIYQRELYPAILVHTWKVVAGVHDLLGTILLVFIKQSLKYGVDTTESELISQLVVTLASLDPRYISMKLCDRILRRISSASQFKSEDKRIENYPKWDEILVLTRFLHYLSFENILTLEYTLPSILHICVLMSPTHSLFMRSALLSLVINSIHSLVTKMPPPDEKNQTNLQALLAEVTETRFRVLFMGSGSIIKSDNLLKNISTRILRGSFMNLKTKTIPKVVEKISLEKSNSQDSITPDSPTNQPSMKDINIMKSIEKSKSPRFRLERIPVKSTESVSRLFLEIIKCYQQTDLGKRWQKQWLDLTRKSAFTPSIIQSRSMATFGLLSERPIPPKLVGQIFIFMKPLIIKEKMVESEVDLCISLILCLTHLYPLLDKDSPLKISLFWVAISLIQLRDSNFFQAGIEMIDVILRDLEKLGKFESNSIENVFMSFRKQNKDADRLLSKMEKIIGINFQIGFSFALSSILLPARKMPFVKSSVISLFRTIVDISCKTESTGFRSSYITALASSLPTKEIAEFKSHLGNYFDWEGEIDQLLFNQIIQHDPISSTLLVYLIASILAESDYDSDQLFLLEILSPAVELFPDSFSAFYDLLTSKLFHIISYTQSKPVQNLALKLTHYLISRDLKKKKNINNSVLLYFSGLHGCVSFAELDSNKNNY